MPTAATELVLEWICAYYEQRDDDLVALAHPEVEIRPRAGQGERLYTGLDGVRRWLADTTPRSDITAFTVAELPDGRVLAEATLEGIDVVGVFELCDERIRAVTMYISDRRILEELGKIGAPIAPAVSHRVEHA